MDLREHLIQGIDYDLWANRLWADALPLFPDPARAQEVMQHIYWASHIWLERASGWVGREFVPLSENWSIEGFARLAEGHQQILRENDLDVIHEWMRPRDGLKRKTSLTDLARHVINHGTYHRGHLRGLAEAAGIADFPDTDVIFYLDKHRP